MNAGERVAVEEAEFFVAKERLTIDGETGIVAPTPPKIDLATALDVRREMAKVYREVRAKRIDPADGTKLVYILAQVGKMIELHEVEARITALEARQNGKQLSSPHRAN